MYLFPICAAIGFLPLIKLRYPLISANHYLATLLKLVSRSNIALRIITITKNNH